MHSEKCLEKAAHYNYNTFSLNFNNQDIGTGNNKKTR